MAKTIYKFHKLVFDTGDSSLECFNRMTQNYAWAVAAGSGQMLKDGEMSLLNITRRNNDR